MTKAPPFQLDKASLEEVMAYRNDRLVQAFQERLKLSKVKAELLFKDVKLFLYLSDFSLAAIFPPKPIDDGWHEFMLFSKDYREFCLKYFGRFIDHSPILKGERPGNEPLPSVLIRAQELFGKDLSENWNQIGGECSADCTFGPSR